jgi:hypothetical protein
MMNRRVMLGVFLGLSSLSIAQTLVGVTGIDTVSTFNKEFLAQRHAEAKTAQSTSLVDPKVVVFAGDRVFPQVVNGGGWKTSFFLVNLENHPVTFQILFLTDDGNDMFVPVVGLGVVRQVSVTLDTAGSTEFETTGFSSGSSDFLQQGWALLSQTTNDTIGGMAIFRQRVFGRPDQEATVPIVSQFDSHFVLLFDNTAGFTTGLAVANPTLSSVSIPVTIRDQSGNVIDNQFIRLGSYSHTAFNLPDLWRSTAGTRGAIEFQTSGFGVAALGLRAGSAAFTSFNVLENINWR